MKMSEESIERGDEGPKVFRHKFVEDSPSGTGTYLVLVLTASLIALLDN